MPLEQLQAAASKAIAEATGAEAGLVTAGAAAALTLGTAAILTRYDLGRMDRLPHCEGFPNEFVVAREHRNSYDHAVRAAGARLVEVGFHEILSGAGVRRAEAWEYEAAFGPRTAGVLYVMIAGAQPPLEEVVRRRHAHHLPVLVDAAAELPPRANLKALGRQRRRPGGLQRRQRHSRSAGHGHSLRPSRADRLRGAANARHGRPLAVVAAAGELFDRDKLAGMPRHGIGRGFKVSKEQIVALLTALQAVRQRRVRPRTGRLSRAAEHDRQLRWPTVRRPAASNRDHAECLPILEITIDERALGRTAFDVCRALRAGSPPCYVGHVGLPEGKLMINPLHLDERRAAELARRLREELTP